MRRKLVDATKAWRMRRTRGDIGLRLFFAAAARVVDFFAEGLLAPVLPFFAAVVEDFFFADFGVAGLVEADDACGSDAAGADFVSELPVATGGEVSCGNATECAVLRKPHRAPSASTRHNLRPNRPTLIIFARRREHQNLSCDLQRCRHLRKFAPITE